MLPIAASIVIMIFVWKNNYNATDQTDINHDISYTELAQSDFVMQIDEQLIADAYLSSINTNELSDEEQYLIDNNISEEIINETYFTN